MKGIWVIFAVSIGCGPGAVAKDRTIGEATSQVDSGAEPSGVRESPGFSSRSRSSGESGRDEPTEKRWRSNDVGGMVNSKALEDSAADDTPVKAVTAPVPVKSLGIDPALAPKKTPGPKMREAETRKVKIGLSNAIATQAALNRKVRSEIALRADGVPVNLKLPAIVDAGQASPRTHEQVVRRTLAILCTAVKGEGLDQATVEMLIDDFGIREDLSPAEKAFIAAPNPPTFDRVQYAWRYEAAWAMLWALSAVDDLSPPRAIVDVRSIGAIVRGETVESLVAKTRLRPIEEILDEADLIYRYRWALVDSQLKDREPPANLDPGIALERHRALNWLIGYLGQSWDEVTTDT